MEFDMTRGAEGRHELRTDPRFWNQIGPFGGWLAAAALHAMRREVEPQFRPRAFNAHFVGALQSGTIDVEVRVLRRQRTVVAMRAELRQGDSVGVSAECVFGIDRTGPAYAHPAPPAMQPPHAYERMRALEPLARFPAAFDYRVARGEPARREGEFDSCGYVRLEDVALPSPEDLLLLADAWYPAAWAGLARPVPVTTLALSVFFHRSPPAAMGHGYLAAHHRASEIGEGYGDERGELWWPDGSLALQCQQMVWVDFAKAHALSGLTAHA